MTKFTESEFNNDRLHGLLAYLDRLTRLEDVNYTCTREVAECITAIRDELLLTKKNVTTAELQRELSTREGVTTYEVDIDERKIIDVRGPAVVSVNVD